MDNNIKFYNTQAPQLLEQYNSVTAEAVHQAWLHLLPKSGKVLDVGAGSGRDSSFIANTGLTLTAVEPANELLTLAQKTFPNPNITWLNDSLPNLNKVQSLNEKYDLILVSAVWMHLTEDLQQRSLHTLSELLNDNGTIIITLRIGTFSDERTAFPISIEKLKQHALSYNLYLKQLDDASDKLNRSDVSWKTVALTKEINLK